MDSDEKKDPQGNEPLAYVSIGGEKTTDPVRLFYLDPKTTKLLPVSNKGFRGLIFICHDKNPSLGLFVEDADLAQSIAAQFAEIAEKLQK